MQSHPLVVFVRGFLDIDWTCHRQVEAKIRATFPNARFLVVDPSPVASLHDRACQIFYELKGGRCFFGEAHSKFHGHSPYGDEYEGKLKEWDAYSPIHLIGHSFGGNTARVLVQYLADGFFPGFQTSARWVASLTIVGSPQRGAISCYALGMSMEQPPHIRWLSPGFMIGVLVHLVEHAGLTAVTKMGHWPQGWLTLAQALLGVSQVYAGTDNAAYDMTQQSQEHWSEHLQVHPELYYFNVVCTKNWGRTMATPLFVRCCHAVVYGMVRLQRWIFGPPIRGELVRSLKDCDIPDGFDGILHAFEQVPRDEQFQLVNPEESPRLLRQGQWYTFMFPSDHVGVLRDEAFAQLFASNIKQAIECSCSPTCAASRKKHSKELKRHPSQQLPPAPPVGAHGHTAWSSTFRLTLLMIYLASMYMAAPVSPWNTVDGSMGWLFIACFCVARIVLPRSYWIDVAHLFKGLLVVWYLCTDTTDLAFHRHVSLLLFVDVVMFCVMLSEVPWNSGLVGMACRSLFLGYALQLLPSYNSLVQALMVIDVSYLLLVLSKGLSMVRHTAQSWWKLLFLAIWGCLVFCDSYNLLASLQALWEIGADGAILDALRVFIFGVVPTAFLSTLKMTNLSDHYQLIVRRIDNWYASC